MFVPTTRVAFADTGLKTNHPTPIPARNVTKAIANTTAMLMPLAAPERFASAGGAPPPAMPGANACHYLNVTGSANVGTSRELAPMRCRSIGRASEAFLEDVEARVEHVPRNVERGDVPHRRVAAWEEDQAVLVRVLLDRVAAFRIRLLRMLVRDELRRLHHPEAAAVPDELVSFGHLIKALREVLPDLRAPGHEALFLDHIERGQRRGARDRVPAERVRVLPALLEVHLRGIHRGTDRQPATQGLC